MECKPGGTPPCSTQKKNKTLHVVSPVKAPIDFKGDSYVRRKCCEINGIMPKNPETFVKIVRHLWNQCNRSPRKRSYLKQLWPEENKLNKWMLLLGKYKAQRKQMDLQCIVTKIKAHYKSLRQACRQTSMHWNEFHRATKLHADKILVRKNFTRKLSTDDTASIEDFFNSDAASFPLPDKKYAGRRFMKSSPEKTLKMYNLLDSTTRRISLSTLRNYKPKHIRLRGKIPLRQSCCEKCQNFENILEVGSKHLRNFPKTIEKAVTGSQCEYSKYFPAIQCAMRNCSVCGTQKSVDQIRSANRHLLHDRRKRVMVKQWKTMKETMSDNGKIKSYMHWKYHSLNYEELLDMYQNQLESMSKHSFLAAWNFHQYIVCKNNLEEGEIAVVLDYAQNYLCKHQNEVQGTPLESCTSNFASNMCNIQVPYRWL